MPVYNCEKYLSESIESVISQTYKNWELIIVNDASTDQSREVAVKFSEKDSRILVLGNNFKKGLAGALNTGLDNSTGEFIARADGDDINKVDRIETQVKFLNNNKNIDIVGGGYQLFGAHSNEKIFHPSSSLIISWKFLSNTYFCHPSVMFRKKVLSTLAHYPECACEDFAFFSKVLKNHMGQNIRKILLNYRQHPASYSNTATENIKNSVQETFKENYKFYTGTLENSEIFFDFHSKQNLKLKNLLKITKISYKISQKILDEYHVPKIGLKAFYLYSIIKINILKSLFLPYLRAVYRKIKN